MADPLATIWRSMAVCGHCGQRLHTAKAQGTSYRKYTCLGNVRADPVTGERVPCPVGAFTMSANQLDPASWADLRAWLSDPVNVERLLEDWQEDSATETPPHECGRF